MFTSLMLDQCYLKQLYFGCFQNLDQATLPWKVNKEVLASLEICLYKNPTILNIICWVTGSLKTLYSYFCKFIKEEKKKSKRFLQRILQEIMKKRTILGTSDACSMSHSSQRPSDPATAYYVEDCRIYSYFLESRWIKLYFSCCTFVIRKTFFKLLSWP